LDGNRRKISQNVPLQAKEGDLAIFLLSAKAHEVDVMKEKILPIVVSTKTF